MVAGSQGYYKVSERLVRSTKSLKGVFEGVVTEDNLTALFNKQEEVVEGFTKSMEGQTTILGAAKAAGAYTVDELGKAASKGIDAIGGAGTADAIATAVGTAFTKALTNNPLNVNVGGNIGLQGQNINFSTLSPQQKNDLGEIIKNWMTNNTLGSNSNP